MIVLYVRAPKCDRTWATTSDASVVRPSNIVRDDTFDFQLRVQVLLDQLDVSHQLAHPLEGVVLALDRNDHLSRCREAIDP